MPRPFVYKEVAKSYNKEDRYLASTPCLFGLMHNNEWLISIRPQEYGPNTKIRKYKKLIYSTKGQAQGAVRKIYKEYFIKAQIVEININDLQSD